MDAKRKKEEKYANIFQTLLFFLLFSALAPFTVFSTGGRDAQYISLGVT